MKVRINTHGNPLPESHGEWVDLYTAEDIVLEPLDFKIISLGTLAAEAGRCRCKASSPRSFR